MKTSLFNQFLSKIHSLTAQQSGFLRKALRVTHLVDAGSDVDLEHIIEKRFAEKPSCPHCSNLHIHRWGVRNGRQRYRCPVCCHTFNAFTGTPLARLRHSKKWASYLSGMTHSLTLRKAASAYGTTLKTAFLWRHRFLQVVENDQAPSLTGIVELDETFFRESFKGQRHNIPRPARRRGTDKQTKARRIPVMVARDREDNTADGVLENEGAQALVRRLNGRISIEAVVCADASLAHESLARKLGFVLKELNTSAGERVLEGVFHIQHVNAYHSHLKQWIVHVFHGVATKYLPHYLGWRRLLASRSPLTRDTFIEKISDHWGYQPLKGT